MEKKVIDLIKAHYKSATIYSLTIADGFVYIYGSVSKRQMPFISKRILDAYPEFRFVQFMDYVVNSYSRETLKWMGMYKNVIEL